MTEDTARRLPGNTRVGLLTLHLHVNYGGIIQIAALYSFLKSNGYQPTLLRKEPEVSLFRRVGRAILRAVPGQDLKGVRSRELTRNLHRAFIRRAMPSSSRTLYNSAQLRRAVKSLDVGAVVVGSDQVWRLEYHQDDNSLAYFLDFVDRPYVKKISYAASFGDESWTHPERIGPISKLLQSFDAVSVRERTGVDICERSFGVYNCKLVLDPTLLVDPRFYETLACTATEVDTKLIVTYLLDGKSVGGEIAEEVRSYLGEDSRIVALSLSSSRTISIPEWLKMFMSAKFVVTDSYHGMVFAILFRKNFLAIGNRKRGLDRFRTLVAALGLESRLLVDGPTSPIASLINTDIDFDKVHDRLEELRGLSRAFILDALSSPSLR